MLTQQDNERLCRIGPGTPMGAVFRRYWQPVLLAEELPLRDAPPIRVRLLGEELVAFRDSEGRVGLVDAFCAHRRAPLFFGRNEECGLRCVYHGWKYDHQGNCVDMPNEPAESSFKHKVTITAYPTYEAVGVIWAYMGPKELQPAFPDYEWMRVPEGQCFVSKTYEACNWAQALEGGLDTSHSSFAHNNDIKAKTLRNQASSPKLEVEKTSYGFRYVGIRDLKDRGNYMRGYQYIMPAQQNRGGQTDASTGEFAKYPMNDGHIWVPIDDQQTLVWNIMYASYPDRPVTKEHMAFKESGAGRGPEHYITGSFRLIRNASNDYLIDRDVQRTKTFTGIAGINTQDFALQENMDKPFEDRTKERLGTADLAIIACRQLLLEASYQVAEGKMPRGIDPASHRAVRGADRLLAKETGWREGLAEALTAQY